VNTPTLNKYLSSLKINYISLSENHCAGLDINNNLYTWGDDSFGQCGLNEDNKNNICYFPKKIIINSNFLVNKVQCGKFYTAGITIDGIAFKFGVINYDNDNKDIKKIGGIKFFKIVKENNMKNENNLYFQEDKQDKIYNIFCGEEVLCFVSIKGNLYIYTELQGLFQVKLDFLESTNTQYSRILNDEKQNYYINSVKFIDRTFYAISKNNSVVYEFINYTNKNKPLNLYDYAQNEYDVNDSIELKLLNQPYYVKALFFKMKCNNSDMIDFENNRDSIFKKKKYNIYRNKLSLNFTSNNKFQNSGNLFSNYSKNFIETSNSLNHNVNNSNYSLNRISKISSMLGNIFEKKIENYVKRTQILNDCEGNTFLFGKKRIELIRVDYINSEDVYLLENKDMNDFYMDTNAFNVNNILNIPINENYGRNKNIEEKKKIKEKEINLNNLGNNINDNKNKVDNKYKNEINSLLNNNDENKEKKLKEKLEKKSNNLKFNDVNENYNNELDLQEEKIKERIKKLREKNNEMYEERKNAIKNKEILFNQENINNFNKNNTNKKIITKEVDFNERKGNNILEKMKNKTDQKGNIEKEKNIKKDEKNKLPPYENNKVSNQKSENKNSKKENNLQTKKNLNDEISRDSFNKNNTLNKNLKDNFYNENLNSLKDISAIENISDNYDIIPINKEYNFTSTSGKKFNNNNNNSVEEFNENDFSNGLKKSKKKKSK
jgi:hypothetical protein